jgi:hypothetical protein
MSDPLNDPRFPERPTHPDFWRISEVVLQNDGGADEGRKTMEEMVSETVDLKSLSYFAMQRAGTFCQRLGLPESMVTALASAWLDAFMAGAKYQERGGHQA